MKSNSVSFAAIIFLMGCSTISKKDFRPTQSDTKSSPLVGRITINLDGDDFTENCKTFWTIGGDTNAVYALDSSGEVKMMPKQNASVALTKVQCKGFDTYTHNFWPALPATVNGQEGELSHFGTIKLIWKTSWKLNPISLAAGVVSPVMGANALYKSGPIEIQNDSDTELQQTLDQYPNLNWKKRTATIKVIDLSKQTQ